jgi:hypothetical protein
MLACGKIFLFTTFLVCSIHLTSFERRKKKGDFMEKYKEEALAYLLKLEKLCEWLEFVKYQSSFADFVKAGIITRGELRDPKYVSLRRDIIFWKGNRGWTRARDWKAALENKRIDFNQE